MKTKPCRARRGPRLRLVATLLLCAASLFTGCVSNKYKVASAIEAQPQRLDLALGGAPAQVRLDTVIIYQGPGSWKKSAYWDEFVVTFTNEGPAPLTLAAASLVDYAGAPVPAGTDPWQLEKASRTQRDRYTASGVNFALNALGYTALTYGAAGFGAFAGAALTSTWSGFATGALVGVAALPVTAIVVHANNQKHKHAIEGEFNHRRLALPLTLAPGESRTGSLFFPMTVGPQALRLEWSRAAGPETSLLPLPLLAGMHRQEPATLKP